MPTELPLEGGRTTPGVVRVDDTVRRPRGRRSVFATEALVWLADQGYPYAPRYLGTDETGRDIVEFVEGETTDHPSQRDESAYATVALMLRALHELTRGNDLVGAGRSLLHGDPGPFNVICRDGRPVTLIDWDSARPGDPIEDVGYAAWTWCVQSAGNVPVQDQARRLRAFRDAYDGTLPPDVLLGAIETEQQRIVHVESGVLADPDAPQGRREHAGGAIAWARSDGALLHERRGVFEAALTAR